MTIQDEATRLTTQPLPVQQARRGDPFGPLRMGWRQLTSMRTALLLLFLLALASVPGGFLPQRRINPLRVNQYIVEHKTLGPLLDRLQMFDVFSSVWFAAIYLLLFISLVGCLLPRSRLHLRALLRKPPKLPATLSRLPAHDRWETTADSAAILVAARKTLRGARWRVVRRDGALSAEKGYLRETGNLAFHLSLVLLLIGIAMGAFGGFKGTVLVVEGRGFANTIYSYDDKTPGRRFSPDSLVPFGVNLEDFRATYGTNGKALTFDADVRWTDGKGTERPYDIRVNHPLKVNGANTYLIGHGYAPRLTVRDGQGNLAMDHQPVPCLPQDAQFLSTCVIKVPDAAPKQLGFRGVFTPTTVTDAQGRVGSTHPALNRPFLTLVAFEGDLLIDSGAPQSIYSLDTDAMKPIDGGRAKALLPGQTMKLPGGASLTYEGTSEWATFQVTQDPGKKVALAASIGIVVGLLLSLFIRRRRLWVRVGDLQGATRTVEVGGLSRTDAERFTMEFAALTDKLRAVAPPTAVPAEE